ncbi:Accessory protein regulator B [Paenibacillus algicola]|uniref:Accessory protein regulator B n=1 Tax=Paenibacillus algicola TaxID=2565926 RepID=A0A4P8XJK1_9BACL|nr:accessory gene regulator B family protein [Paenibacillus algicola]QCT01720.1 Accessory protein regulator B [Paenibacillus algicola]
MKIEHAALRMAQAIKKEVPEHPSSIAVLKHGIAILLNMTGIVSAVLLISWAAGTTAEALTAMISFALLRQVSGGVHLKTGAACILLTTLLLTLISWVHLPQIWTHGFTAGAFILTAMYAPSRIEYQSRIPRTFYRTLTFISCMLIMTNFVIQSDIIAASFLVQAMTLIRLKGGENPDPDPAQQS